MYCSRNDGDTFSTFATLSKPSLSSSFGNSALTSTSSASISAIAFAYSVRFRRCSATCPGFGSRGGRGVELALEPGDPCAPRRLVRLRRAGRRHLRAAQLAHGGLEDLGLVRDRLRGHAVERDLRREVVAVVAVDAVLRRTTATARRRSASSRERRATRCPPPSAATATIPPAMTADGSWPSPPTKHQMTPPSSRRCANPPL